MRAVCGVTRVRKMNTILGLKNLKKTILSISLGLWYKGAIKVMLSETNDHVLLTKETYHQGIIHHCSILND